jgi:hypothetical protein
MASQQMVSDIHLQFMSSVASVRAVDCLAYAGSTQGTLQLGWRLLSHTATSTMQPSWRTYRLQYAGMFALCMWWLLMTLYWFSWERMPQMVSGRTLQETPGSQL